MIKLIAFMLTCTFIAVLIGFSIADATGNGYWIAAIASPVQLLSTVYGAIWFIGVDDDET